MDKSEEILENIAKRYGFENWKALRSTGAKMFFPKDINRVVELTLGELAWKEWLKKEESKDYELAEKYLGKEEVEKRCGDLNEKLNLELSIDCRNKTLEAIEEMKEEEVADFWNNIAEKHGVSLEMSTTDVLIKELEMETILKECSPGQKVLDVGCGNGFLCKALVAKGLEVTGIDFSQGLIDSAKKVEPKAEFLKANVLSLPFEDNYFDLVISERCIINLVSHRKQLMAIDEIARVLKPNCNFLMCECTIQGLKSLNKLRKQFNLSKIKPASHNLYLNEKDINKKLKSLTLLNTNNFSSTYYLCSRIINAKLTPKGQKPDYFSEVNKIGIKLPPLGNYGQLKLFTLKKEEALK